MYSGSRHTIKFTDYVDIAFSSGSNTAGALVRLSSLYSSTLGSSTWIPYTVWHVSCNQSLSTVICPVFPFRCVAFTFSLWFQWLVLIISLHIVIRFNRPFMIFWSFLFWAREIASFSKQFILIIQGSFNEAREMENWSKVNLHPLTGLILSSLEVATHRVPRCSLKFHWLFPVRPLSHLFKVCL